MKEAKTVAHMAESALNAFLAQELDPMMPGWVLTTESTYTLTDSSRAPDILVETEVAPISIETEYMPATSVEDDALSRIGATVASSGMVIESAVALRIPIRLREVPSREMLAALRSATDFEWCVWIEGPNSVRFPSQGYIKGSLADLATFVETVAVSERRIAALANDFESGVSQAATRLRTHFKRIGGQSALDKIAGALHLRDSEQTSVIAVAILANALVFQTAVSAPLGTPRIEELRNEHGDITVAEVLETWRKILKSNYWPIFAVASEVLKPIGEEVGQPLLQQLSAVVSKMAKGGVLEAGDLAGQMFGRLIADRKFLATFYTLPASATMLAELAIKRFDERVEWVDAGAVNGLRVADFACGTGMLLSAVYRRISSRVRRTGRLENVDQTRLMHAAFMEEILIGCDIMPAAVHLTASILSAAYPSNPFGYTNIHLMPYGYSNGDKAMGASIGSLELLGDESVRSLLGTGRSRTGGVGDQIDVVGQTNGASADYDFMIGDASVDLVIQNPPFTRPNGPEAGRVGVPIPSFAGFETAEDEQKAMAARLQGLNPKGAMRVGRGHAGLDSNFIDLAHAKLRHRGVLALVLKATFASGDAWAPARNLLAREYQDITIVSLAANSGDDRAFSADTGMAEVLVVATRKEDRGSGGNNGSGDIDGLSENFRSRENDGLREQDGLGEKNGLGNRSHSDVQSRVWVNWVTLNKRPENPVEAVNATNAIAAAQADFEIKSGNGRPYSFLSVGEEHIGCQIFAPLSEGGCAHLTEPMVASAASGLRCGRLHLPRIGPIAVPVVALAGLGKAGPHNGLFNNGGFRTDKEGNPKLDKEGRVIRNGVFNVERKLKDPESCEFPAIWGHDVASGRERSMVVEPDRDLRPWPGHQERARKLWTTATRLHYNRDFQLNSQALSACITPHRALGGSAWPSFILDQEEFEVPLLLWANTTIGLIGHWWIGTRQQAGRTRLSIRTLPNLPALDCRQLTQPQLDRLEEIFDSFKDRPLLAANEALRDEVRIELDEAVFCDALALHSQANVDRKNFLESLTLLRRQWCLEPSVHAGKPPLTDLIQG